MCCGGEGSRGSEVEKEERGIRSRRGGKRGTHAFRDTRYSYVAQKEDFPFPSFAVGVVVDSLSFGGGKGG